MQVLLKKIITNNPIHLGSRNNQITYEIFFLNVAFQCFADTCLYLFQTKIQSIHEHLIKTEMMFGIIHELKVLSNSHFPYIYAELGNISTSALTPFIPYAQSCLLLISSYERFNICTYIVSLVGK